MQPKNNIPPKFDCQFIDGIILVIKLEKILKIKLQHTVETSRMNETNFLELVERNDFGSCSNR